MQRSLGGVPIEEARVVEAARELTSWGLVDLVPDFVVWTHGRKPIDYAEGLRDVLEVVEFLLMNGLMQVAILDALEASPGHPKDDLEKIRQRWRTPAEAIATAGATWFGNTPLGNDYAIKPARADGHIP